LLCALPMNLVPMIATFNAGVFAIRYTSVQAVDAAKFQRKCLSRSPHVRRNGNRCR
jgi:hypothetical protein